MLVLFVVLVVILFPLVCGCSGFWGFFGGSFITCFLWRSTLVGESCPSVWLLDFEHVAVVCWFMGSGLLVGFGTGIILRLLFVVR